jgi:hypothetical protein
MDFVTNRTSASVYGYEDLNRVETAVEAIGRESAILGFGFSPVTKTDWALPGDFIPQSWPVHSQMVRYLNNITQINGLFFCAVPLPASMERLTWVSANNIEKVLKIALERIEGIKESYRYSGEIFAGEELI